MEIIALFALLCIVCIIISSIRTQRRSRKMVAYIKSIKMDVQKGMSGKELFEQCSNEIRFLIANLDDISITTILDDKVIHEFFCLVPMDIIKRGVDSVSGEDVQLVCDALVTSWGKN